jgi:hypothetical protein
MTDLEKQVCATAFMLVWCLGVLVVKGFEEVLGYACEHISLDNASLL